MKAGTGLPFSQGLGMKAGSCLPFSRGSDRRRGSWLPSRGVAQVVERGCNAIDDDRARRECSACEATRSFGRPRPWPRSPALASVADASSRKIDCRDGGQSLGIRPRRDPHPRREWTLQSQHELRANSSRAWERSSASRMTTMVPRPAAENLRESRHAIVARAVQAKARRRVDSREG